MAYSKLFITLLLIIALTGCPMPHEMGEVSRDIPLDIETATYIDSQELHVPDFFAGVWELDYGDKWGLSNAGVIQPWNCTCYPNPVTPTQFLSAGGTTIEEMGPDGYRFFASATFPYKTYTVYGECSIEIKRDGTGWKVNRTPAWKVE